MSVKLAFSIVKKQFCLHNIYAIVIGIVAESFYRGINWQISALSTVDYFNDAIGCASMSVNSLFSPAIPQMKP